MIDSPDQIPEWDGLRLLIDIVTRAGTIGVASFIMLVLLPWRLRRWVG